MYLHCKKHLVLLILSFVYLYGQANDGSYYGSGNQLIPISENDISISKEILSIERNQTNPELVDVTVYYEFFNSGKAKNIIVGFEAFSASGDADPTIHNDGSPYMSNFNVDLNGQKLPYEVTIVADSIYYRNGVIKAITQKQLESIETDQDWSNYFYVYHFDAHFKTGINVVTHKYTYRLSGSVMSTYDFDYVLSAAMRWGNKQIDDFTLNIDMGNNQLICIPQTFFDNTSQWVIDGIGKSSTLDNSSHFVFGDETTSVFFVREGKLIFKKINFKPKGELNFYSPQTFWESDSFNYLTDQSIPYNLQMNYDQLTPSNELSLKILRNLAFAYRGYVFTNPDLKEYFEKQIWYYPNPSYEADIEQLTEPEKESLSYWTNYTIKPQQNENNVFDYRTSHNISYYVYVNSDIDFVAANTTSQKILRNLPYAYRGYVFSNPDLKEYFEKQAWYKPNPNYKAEINDLTQKEKDWIKKYE